MIGNSKYKALAISSLCNALLTDSDLSVRCSAAEALGKIGSEEAVIVLAEALNNDLSADVRQKVAEALGKICSPEQLNELNLLSKLVQVFKTMSEKPNINMQFNASVSGAAGNVEGNQIINNPAQDLTEAAARIRLLLDQLAQIYKIPSQAIVVDEIKKEINHNPTLKARLINASKAGGIEALKAIFNHPSVSVPVEMIKGFLETEVE